MFIGSMVYLFIGGWRIYLEATLLTATDEKLKEIYFDIFKMPASVLKHGRVGFILRLPQIGYGTVILMNGEGLRR